MFNNDIIPEHVKGIVALNRAIIYQALLDLGKSSRGPNNELFRKQAAFWLNINNALFIGCCNDAFLHPDPILKLVKRIKAGELDLSSGHGIYPRKPRTIQEQAESVLGSKKSDSHRE